MELLLPLLVVLALCFAVAHFLGRKRQIGFGWSLFFCIFLSPIVGFIVTMLSPKYFDEDPSPSKGKQIGGWVLIALASLSVLGQFMALSTGNAEPSAFNTLFLTVGFIGAGAYLVGRGKGKNYNSAAVQTVE